MKHDGFSPKPRMVGCPSPEAAAFAAEELGQTEAQMKLNSRKTQPNKACKPRSSCAE